MENNRRTYMILLFGLSILLLGPLSAFPATVGDIAQELTCTCGCNLLVSACEGTMECGPAADIKQQISEMLDNGLSRDAIIASFVNRFGEKILSSPTKRGFNLTAWVLPFAAALFAVGVIYALLKNWASRKESRREEVAFKEEDRDYLDRIEKELRSFEG